MITRFFVLLFYELFKLGVNLIDIILLSVLCIIVLCIRNRV